MKTTALVAFAAVAALGMGALSLADTARAAHVRVDLAVPDQPALGQPMEVQAHFHSESEKAIPDLTVTFHEEVTFGGVTSDVELGRAVTDEDGFAALAYEPRTAGTHEIQVRYTYADGEEEDAVASLTVPAAGQQLYRSTAGVKIPGLNVWLLMALVAAVWTVLLTVALRVIAIARAGSEEPPEAPSLGRTHPRPTGFAGGR